MNWQEITSYNYPTNIFDYNKKPKKKRNWADDLWCLCAAILIGTFILLIICRAV